MANAQEITLAKYVNALKINLWYYLDIVEDSLTYLSDSSHSNDWCVALTSMNIDKHSIGFNVVLRVSGSDILLDALSVDCGLADGRVVINTRGVYLDMSPNGQPVSDLSAIKQVELNPALVIVPPANARPVTREIKVGSGLSVEYVAHPSGGDLTIALNSAAQATTSDSEQGILSINGVSPSDGQLSIVGVGDYSVTIAP